MRDTSESALKRRMKEHVERLAGWSLSRVAKATGDDYKNVLRWVSGDTTMPADFVARFIEHVPVDALWLMTGEPSAVGENGDAKGSADPPPPYNEGREEEELARVGGLPDPLLRTMERESIAAVIRAQGMRDACRAARIEAEKAPPRGMPDGLSSETVKEAAAAWRAWTAWQRRQRGHDEWPPQGPPEPPGPPRPGE